MDGRESVGIHEFLMGRCFAGALGLRSLSRCVWFRSRDLTLCLAGHFTYMRPMKATWASN
jgi:hypothetical protein